jgi:hypothetical protein
MFTWETAPETRSQKEADYNSKTTPTIAASPIAQIQPAVTQRSPAAVTSGGAAVVGL